MNMEFFLPIAEVYVSLPLIFTLSLVVGILSGLFGVGGGFLMTPFLIFLGVPPAYAVPNEANNILGTSISGSTTHYLKGTLDYKMGLMIVAGGTVGTLLGILTFTYFQDIGKINIVISLSYMYILAIIGTMMLVQGVSEIDRARKKIVLKQKLHSHYWIHGLPFRMRFKKSRLYESIFTPIIIGLIVGFIAAIMGVGGAFILVPAMIFIIGMPRSGTSLIEKIVSSHRNVFGAGEREEISKAVNNLAANYGKKDQYAKCASLLDKRAIREAAEFYLQSLTRTTNSQFVCDKMPLNFIHLGFIYLMFPNAKVIHCKRDFRDIALSCYFQNFSHPYPWSYNFTDIQHYLRIYSDLMSHWKKVLPMDIIETGYEELIDDFENNVRILLDSLNLPWDNSCLEFYKSEGVVQTASKWQVREPINSGSVSKWKNYEKHLPSELISAYPK